MKEVNAPLILIIITGLMADPSEEIISPKWSIKLVQLNIINLLDRRNNFSINTSCHRRNCKCWHHIFLMILFRLTYLSLSTGLSTSETVWESLWKQPTICPWGVFSFISINSSEQLIKSTYSLYKKFNCISFGYRNSLCISTYMMNT